MKRLTGILLVLFLFINQTSVQAATKDTIKLSMSNIEDIIIEYSPEYKMIKNNLKADEQRYEDKEDEIDDTEDDIRKLENEIKLQEESKPLDNKEQPESKDSKEKNNESKSNDHLKKDKDKLKKKKDELDSLKYEKKELRHELQISRIKYEKELKVLVESTQKQYVQYVDTLLKKDLKQAESKIKNKQIEINNLKYGNGFISKKEYEKNIDDITDFNNELNELEIKEKNQLEDLLFSLGIKDKNNIKFDVNIGFDIDKISKINFREDLDEMLLNNIDLKIKDIENDKAEDQSDRDDTKISDYEIKNNKISLKQEEEKIKMEFQKKYNNLIFSTDLVKAHNDKLSRTENDSLIMQTKYDYGFASKKQLEQLDVDLNNKNQDFISQVNNLYMDYLSYMKMKDGY
ncbi:viral A-type inclusion protein [Clostridium taeniosporum]|uniref:Viral A-type inclusion protein n=1 Tax=Clostridium taeniosporum TaxID=394958 RepID=A0A1D7XM54_9CLOT|nr:viral A-type inclusion protein [Clostridium taeniosporum]AOR24179.1 viral A-type inclusion protein [Clostridium taeniosporum]